MTKTFGIGRRGVASVAGKKPRELAGSQRTNYGMLNFFKEFGAVLMFVFTALGSTAYIQRKYDGIEKDRAVMKVEFEKEKAVTRAQLEKEHEVNLATKQVLEEKIRNQASQAAVIKAEAEREIFKGFLQMGFGEEFKLVHKRKGDEEKSV